MRRKLRTTVWLSAAVALTYVFARVAMTVTDVRPEPRIVAVSPPWEDSRTVNTRFLDADDAGADVKESGHVNAAFLEAEHQQLKQAAVNTQVDGAVMQHAARRPDSETQPAEMSGDLNSGKEVRHVVLLKVHKTASSTAQSVFLRYGDSRNLTFVLAHTNGESGWLNVISYVNSITRDNVVPPPPGLHYDILCCHVIYNKAQFSSVLPADTVYIGIVREPFSRFQSAVRYFSPQNILGIPGDHPVSTFARNPLKYEKADPRTSQTNNRMAVEFGFPLELFPGGHNSSCISCVNEYLSQVERDFKFIIISELFDESMVYMKRLLNWRTKDILYLDQNVAPSKINTRKKMQDGDKEYLKNFLTLDIALYNFAVNRFTEQTNKEGVDFRAEVERFQTMRQQVNHFCHNTSTGSIEFGETKHNKPFSIDRHDCQMFVKHEKDLIQKQRLRLYGTLDN